MIQWRANFRPYFGLTPYDNVGSFEFYLSYAVKNELAITLDTRYLHPTEFVSDKISAVIPYLNDKVLHLSRGIGWDSDLNDELIAIMAEIVRADAIDKVHIDTDFFDGSINRVGALAIGARAVSEAFLYEVRSELISGAYILCGIEEKKFQKKKVRSEYWESQL
jgi:L-rhamnose isomerase